MSAGAIVAIIAAVVVVLVVIGALSVARRRKLQQRFGPEYDRVVSEKHSHRKADAELAERERRFRSLDIRPLDDTVRARYAGEWAAIQERFVDQPEQAVTQAGILVTSVMKDRGYPTENYEQMLSDLSVEHAGTLDHYRQAHQVSLRAETGAASTEDMRLAMLHYRSLFADLLGPQPAAQPAAAQPAGPATAHDAPAAHDEPATAHDAPATAHDAPAAHDEPAAAHDEPVTVEDQPAAPAGPAPGTPVADGGQAETRTAEDGRPESAPGEDTGSRTAVPSPRGGPAS